MEQNVFTKLRNGEAVNMHDAEYAPAIAHMTKMRNLCQRINLSGHDAMQLQPLIGEMLGEKLKEGTFITPPVQIDFGCQMAIGSHVFINHSLCCMSAGGITIDDNTQIGPEVTMVTTNHDFDDRMTLRCRRIHVCRNVWIGAHAVILPGVTIGENAVVAAGSVVTKDVEPNTIVGGNPAKVIRKLNNSKI